MKNDDRGAGGYRLPLLPLRDIIVFPHMVVPLFVGRDKSLSALEEAMAGDKQLLLAAQRRAKTDDPSEDDIFSIGTVVRRDRGSSVASNAGGLVDGFRLRTRRTSSTSAATTLR